MPVLPSASASHCSCFEVLAVFVVLLFGRGPDQAEKRPISRPAILCHAMSGTLTSDCTPLHYKKRSRMGHN